MILPKIRDKKFITVRRGGTLSDEDHHLLAVWADSTSEDFFNDSYMDREKLEKLINLIEDTNCHYCILGHADSLTKCELLYYLKSV